MGVAKLDHAADSGKVDTGNAGAYRSGLKGALAKASLFGIEGNKPPDLLSPKDIPRHRQCTMRFGSSRRWCFSWDLKELGSYA